jgi:hypothetical protein
MSFLSSLALVLLASLAIAACPAASWPRRALRGGAMAAALASPWCLPAAPSLPRLLLALWLIFFSLRAVDLERDPGRRSLGPRLRFLFSPVDPRELRRRPREVSLRGLSRALAFLALAAAGAALAFVGAPALPQGTLALRWLGGVVLIYGAAEALASGYATLMASLGFEVPDLIRDPILARSVARFWSRRYNLEVSRWLARHVHRPLAERDQPQLGRAAAFAVSAALHVYCTLPPLGLAWAGVMGSFFVVQGAAVVLERAPGAPGRWPRAAQHAWTVTWLLVTSPLFVEPFLRALEG